MKRFACSSRVAPSAVIAACALATLAAQERRPWRPSTSSLQSVARAGLDELQARGLFPGASLSLVLPDGRTISCVSGVTEADTKAAMPKAPRMMSGSIGKTYVAAAIALLVERGKLRFSDKLASHLGDEPWFEKLPNAGSITLHHLLRHTSGVPRYVMNTDLWKRLLREPDKRIAARDCIATILGRAAYFPAGKRFSYADTNYLLLGLVLEKVTGEDFYAFVQREFFERHGLKESFPTNKRELAGLVQGTCRWTRALGMPERTLVDDKFVIHPGFEWCGGGFYGTTADLARWARILWSGRAFVGNYLGTLLDGVDAARGSFGPKASYGAGTIQRQSLLGRSFGHDGFFPGYMSSMAWFPEVRVAAAVQINADMPVVNDTVRGIDLHAEMTKIAERVACHFYQTDAKTLRRARSVHTKTLTLDTHKDISPLLAKVAPRAPETRDGFRLRYDPRVCGLAQVDFPKMRAGGLDCAFFIVYVGQGALTDIGFHRAHKAALAKFDAIERMAERFPQDIEIARSADDVERIAKRGKLVACIGIENGYPMGRDLSRIAEYHRRGARYMSITHNRHSQLGDSHTPAKPLHGGLSELGRKAIAEMNRVGIMVDISHSSKTTMLEATAASKAPVIASHSACHAVFAHGRNLDDEQLRVLRDNGGVIQIVAFATYIKSYEARRAALKRLREATPQDERKGARYAAALAKIDREHPPSDVRDVCDHVDHAVRTIGLEHVAISSDFDGGGGVDGWRDASETFDVTLELVKRGYDAAAIAKLWSGNTLRVWRAVEAFAREQR